MTTKPILAALILAAATAAASAPAPALTPAQASIGYWRSGIGAIVHIEPCSTNRSAESSGASPDPTLCLRVVQLSPNPPETTDTHNPDPSLRGRGICNLLIGSGFHDYDRYRLGYGHLYDPISGHTYRGYITPAGPDVLKLRGYVLFTLFGRTETWHRVPPVPVCQ